MPLGKFLLSGQNLPSLFIATGVGIAPFKFMLDSLKTKKLIKLLWGLRKKMPNFSYKICLSRQKTNLF